MTKELTPFELREYFADKNIKLRPIIMEAFPSDQDFSRIRGKMYRSTSKFTDDEMNKIIAVMKKYGHEIK